MAFAQPGKAIKDRQGIETRQELWAIVAFLLKILWWCLTISSHLYK
jgi:hypothetical protein